MAIIDDVAEAIYRCRPRRIPWEELSEKGWKAEYRKMAEAAIGALGLTDQIASSAYLEAVGAELSGAYRAVFDQRAKAKGDR